MLKPFLKIYYIDIIKLVNICILNFCDLFFIF